MCHFLNEDENDESNLVAAVYKFLNDVPDVYERARLSRSVVVAGPGGMIPGLADTLLARIDCLQRMHDRRAALRLVDTPFAADSLIWTGASILPEHTNENCNF